MSVVVGKTYKVTHSRKGRFVLRVTAVNGEFATGVIVKGRAHAMLEENEREVGDELAFRIAHCTFEEVAS